MQNQDLSARHFTNSSVNIIEQLFPRWADRSMPEPITEPMAVTLALWSLLRWERKVGLVALERVGVDADALARDVNRALSDEPAGMRSVAPSHPHDPWADDGGRVVDFDTPLEPYLAAAEREALGLGHGWVGTEHLLLAAVRTAGPRLRAVLDRHGVGYDGVRQAVLEVLQSY